MKYRKKPVVVDAVQYFEWMREQDKLPDGVRIVCHRTSVLGEGDWPTVLVDGVGQVVREGYWIITEADGSRTLTSPAHFSLTYEPVEDSPQ